MKDFYQFRELLEAKNSDWKSEPPETPSKIERIWMYSDFKDFDAVFEEMITVFDGDESSDDFDDGQDAYYLAKNYMRQWASSRPDFSYKSKHHKNLRIDIRETDSVFLNDDPILLDIIVNNRSNRFMWVDHDGFNSNLKRKQQQQVAELMERKIWEKEPSMLKWVKGLK